MNRSCNDKHCPHYHKGLCAFKYPEKHCKVKVKCPECGKMVDGNIEYLIPFNSYYAYCEDCNYHITESEWEEVK